MLQVNVCPFVVDDCPVIRRNVFARKNNVFHPAERRNIFIGNAENHIIIGKRLLFRFPNDTYQLAQSNKVTYYRKQKTNGKNHRKYFYPGYLYGLSGQFGYFYNGNVGKIHRKIFDNHRF